MMRTILLAAVLFVPGAIPAATEPPPAPPASSAPKPQPPPCVDARDSADYVPGVDAYGRPVAPADLPGGGEVHIRTEVYPILNSTNPQLNGVGVVANLPGLANRTICPPAPPSDRAVPHR